MLAASGRYVMRLLCLLTAVNQLIIVSAQTARELCLLTNIPYLN